MVAYQQCWFFGDEFSSRSFERYFQARPSLEYNGYVRANFDTKGYFTSQFSENPSIISRMCNLLVHALQSKVDKRLLPLPWLIIIIPDDDLIRCFNEEHSLSTPFSRILNHIMTEHERCISAYKDYLPAKCIRSDSPKILWIQAPSHVHFTNNSQRHTFNRCLEEMAKIHQNVHSLVLKKVWEPNNEELFLKDSQRFTATRYTAYWEAVDRTVCYFHTILLKKQECAKNVKFPGNGEKIIMRCQKDKHRFRRQNPSFNKSEATSRPTYRALPLPPRSVQM